MGGNPKSLERVMWCEELLCKILKCLKSRRDLARCSSVSRMWNRCSAVARIALLSYAIAVDISNRSMWSINLATGRQERLTLPGYRGRNKWPILLAKCRGLALVSVDGHLVKRQLVIGDPGVKKWHVLPSTDMDVCAAVLARDEPGMGAGEVLLMIMDFRGRVEKYESGGGGGYTAGCWVEHCPGVPGLRYWPLFRQVVYYRHGVLSGFVSNDGEEKVFWYSLINRNWSEVKLHGSKIDFFEHLLIAMHWRGKRLLLLRKDHIFELVADFDTRAGYSGFLQATVVDLNIEAMLGYKANLWGVAGNSVDLVWIPLTGGCKLEKHSLIDKTRRSYNIDKRCMIDSWGLSTFTSDEGQALNLFTGNRRSFLLGFLFTGRRFLLGFLSRTRSFLLHSSSFVM